MAAQHPLHLDLARGDDLFAACRQRVEAGVPDVPVLVFREGRHSLSLSSLHRAALLTVREEPGCRFAPWQPHPNATVGPRVRALLDRRAAERQQG